MTRFGREETPTFAECLDGAPFHSQNLAAGLTRDPKSGAHAPSQRVKGAAHDGTASPRAAFADGLLGSSWPYLVIMALGMLLVSGAMAPL